ncbi:putative transcriptional regulator [Salinibacterium sp. CAN_S4]|uniref:ArsR/SmtB family transcription factor n=1 Tax=Salinibacterium sp. CAN_S4 TaxID=2787727 RepID=UPI0018F05001
MSKRVTSTPGGWSEWLEDPIKALGNLVRAGILGYLRGNGPATRAEIAAALEIPVPTIAASLKAMVQAGLLTSDPPMEQVRRGQWVKYGVDNEMVSRMYLQLGQAIGEI